MTGRVRVLVGGGATLVLGVVAAVTLVHPGSSRSQQSPATRSDPAGPSPSLEAAAGPRSARPVTPAPTAARTDPDPVRPSQPTATRPPRSSVDVATPAMLVTNEYAFHHPGATDAVRSAQWMVTSGSLFDTGGQLWSGHPDDRSPGPTSADGNDSAVLRAVTNRADYANVGVSFGLRVVELTQTHRTPRQDTDGVHVILHYQSEFSTYYVSMFRRDGQVTIKKKVPGGPSNGGTYYTLAGAAFPVQPGWSGNWHQIETAIAAVAPGAVRLWLRIDGRAVLDVVDAGADAAVITAPGRVGLRGDNCEFYVRDFSTRPL